MALQRTPEINYLDFIIYFPNQCLFLQSYPQESVKDRLGHPWIVGSYLKYMAYLDGRLVACLGWGSASWKVACRDRFIGWSTPLRKKNLSQVVNNVRFLILPWVKVEHLAYKVLAANIKRVAADWHSLYQETIVLLETFVDLARFQGTCYRAANWQYVGDARGIAKSGNGHCYHGQPKVVYLSTNGLSRV
jgi:hypothetical protein